MLDKYIFLQLYPCGSDHRDKLYIFIKKFYILYKVWSKLIIHISIALKLFIFYLISIEKLINNK